MKIKAENRRNYAYITNWKKKKIEIKRTIIYFKLFCYYILI